MSFHTDDDHAKSGGKPRKGGKIPYPPGRDRPLPEVRHWLSDAAGLPAEVRIDIVDRPGREPEDPLTIILSNGTKMRCPHQSRLQQPRTLQAFLVSESDGIAQPFYLSPAEVGDFYTQLCRMSSPTARADPVADLAERLAAFVMICEPFHGSLGLDRYTTIQAMKGRPVFDRAAAENRNPNQPVLLHDNGQRYIRASEWVAWLRAQGRVVNESGLVARMAEVGSERIHPQAWNADRSHKVHLVLYRLPDDL